MHHLVAIVGVCGVSRCLRVLRRNLCRDSLACLWMSICRLPFIRKMFGAPFEWPPWVCRVSGMSRLPPTRGNLFVRAPFIDLHGHSASRGVYDCFSESGVASRWLPRACVVCHSSGGVFRATFGGLRGYAAHRYRGRLPRYPYLRVPVRRGDHVLLKCLRLLQRSKRRNSVFASSGIFRVPLIRGSFFGALFHGLGGYTATADCGGARIVMCIAPVLRG